MAEVAPHTEPANVEEITQAPPAEQAEDKVRTVKRNSLGDILRGFFLRKQDKHEEKHEEAEVKKEEKKEKKKEKKDKQKETHEEEDAKEDAKKDAKKEVKEEKKEKKEEKKEEKEEEKVEKVEKEEDKKKKRRSWMPFRRAESSSSHAKSPSEASNKHTDEPEAQATE